MDIDRTDKESWAWSSPDVAKAKRARMEITIDKYGTLDGWCEDLRKVMGKCPDGFERNCRDCFCG